MTRKKPKDLSHPVTYKRENGKFDVNWYLKEDRSSWVLPRVLREQAKKLGKKPFLQFGYKKPLSFYQTNRLANRIANALCGLGVEKAKKVAVYMPNSDDYVITWFGILKMGAVMVPINTAYKMDFLEYIIDSSDAEVLFIAEEYLDRMPPHSEESLKAPPRHSLDKERGQEVQKTRIQVPQDDLLLRIHKLGLGQGAGHRGHLHGLREAHVHLRNNGPLKGGHETLRRRLQQCEELRRDNGRRPS